MVDGSTLEVEEGETLSLVGGDIEITNRLDEQPIPPPDGQNITKPTPNLAGTSAKINLIALGPDSIFDIQEFEIVGSASSDIILRNGSFVRTDGDGAGKILIRANSLLMSETSFLDNINTGSQDGRGGIDIGTENIHLSNSTIDSSADDSGNASPIVIEADFIGLDRRSRIGSDNRPSGVSEEPNTGDAGKIAITADKLRVLDESAIGSASFGLGDGGTIVINVKSLEIVANKRLVKGGFGLTGITTSVQPGGQGQAGTITINASQDIIIRAIEGNSSIASSTRNQFDGGIIDINAKFLSIEGNKDADFNKGIFASGVANITSSARAGSSGGNGGNIDLDVGALALIGGDIESRSDVDAVGGAGHIDIVAETITMSEASEIGTQTFGRGDAGQLNITANSILMQDEAFMASTTERGSFGKGGDIKIDVEKVKLINGSEISASTLTASDAGSVEIRAKDIDIVGGTSKFTTGISSRSFGPSGGDAGEISIAASGTISISNRGKITSSTPDMASGDAGMIQIEADKIVLAGFGSEITSSTGIDASGSAGSIEVDANVVEVSDSALIRTLSLGLGPAGSIILNVSNRLRLDDESLIIAATRFTDAGNIIVKDARVVDVRNSAIRTSVANGQGSGGDISIASDFVLLSNAGVIANAREGDGGNIEVDAENFTESNSIVSASSDLGVSGTIVITSPADELASRLLVLDSQFVDVSRLLRENCESGGDLGGSTFVETGRSPPLVLDDGMLPGFYSDTLAMDRAEGNTNDPVVLVLPCPEAKAG